MHSHITGTGKSKLIQTLAKYLERTVVSFKLGQVETVSQLQMLLDDLFTISAELPGAKALTFRDVIFDLYGP